PEPTFTIDGDGTVVTPSALWANGAGVKRYWVDEGQYNKDNVFSIPLGRTHKDILEVPDTISLLENITLNESKVLSYVFSSTPTRTITGARLVYSLHSPLTLDLYDNVGRHTGV